MRKENENRKALIDEITKFISRYSPIGYQMCRININSELDKMDYDEIADLYSEFQLMRTLDGESSIRCVCTVLYNKINRIDSLSEAIEFVLKEDWTECYDFEEWCVEYYSDDILCEVPEEFREYVSVDWNAFKEMKSKTLQIFMDVETMNEGIPEDNYFIFF